MTPYEMMLSESQERMLMVLKPGREDFAEAIFRKWELDFAVIGEVTDTGHMVLEFNGEIVCDIPLGPLADDAPLYERPYLSQADYKAWAKVAPLGDVPQSADIAADLLTLMASPAIASRRWIWEQYDSQVGADTVQTGGDAAIVRVHGTAKGLAMTTDCTPRYCYADPVEGGRQAVAEAYRNLCAVGAKPLAVTNCLNFGNPQRPEIMAQFVGCLEGMADACRALDFPIVSGNVSLYNESKATGGGSAILPTPAIGGVGLLNDWEKSATIAFKDVGQEIFRLGGECGHLGQSTWLREIHGRRDGAPPPVDLDRDRKAGELVRQLVAEGTVTAVHDVSDGGTLVAIAEMALAGRMAASVNVSDELSIAGSLFGEDQGRYLVTIRGDGNDFIARCMNEGVHAEYLGSTLAPEDAIGEITVLARGEGTQIPLADLRAAHEGFFPRLMGNELTPEF
jgi:phosphoribosylformylglycinamidine synthase